MKMIQVLATSGWCDYCPVGLLTDLVDIDGVELQTGDVVEVLEGNWFRADDIPDNDARRDVAMIIADIDTKFINDSRPYVSGWLKQDWSAGRDGNWLIRKVSADLLDDDRHRIV